MSESCEIVIHETQKGGTSADVHGALAAYFDAQLSKLIAGATLLTETQGPGSFALGQVHAGRAFELIAGDAERLAQSFETQVGLPFVQYNGINARPPRLKINIVRDMDPNLRADLFQKALTMGLSLDEDQVRQELQLKAPTGNALEPAVAAAPTGDQGDSNPV
jgi:phage gp29-like protein